MSFWIPMAIGAGMGLLKSQSDKDKAAKMNQAAAIQTKFSPHTGMGPGQITQAASPWESMLQGGMAGAMMGNAMGMSGAAGAGAGASEAASAGVTSAAPAQAANIASPASIPMSGASGDIANTYVAQNKNMFGSDWLTGVGTNSPYSVPQSYQGNTWLTAR